MRRVIVRALAAALMGAAAGAIGLTIAAASHPGLTFEFDRDVPSIATGFYPVERHREETFVWTSGQASLILPGLDRRTDWRCSLRLRGARPAGVDQPIVQFAIDGVTVSSRLAPADYADMEVVAPARPSRHGLSLTIASDPPFVPSSLDRRELGVQLDRLSCVPAGRVWPPGASLRAAAIAGGVMAVAFASLSTAFSTLFLAVGLLAALQSVALSTGGAMYTGYASNAIWPAMAIAVTVILAKAIAHWMERPLGPGGRFTIGFSAAAVYLKLLALFHPSKLIIDAVFHARRFDWVLDGRYYFTQPMPDGVAFPYAIGLYLFAAPWSLLTDDHVALLRIVVTVAEAAAGALLYLMVVRVWGDRLVGGMAVVLFHLVPVPYSVIGNANMTNAFGQSAALVTIALATVLTLRGSQYVQLALLTLVATLAYLSHVSTVSMLAVILVTMAVLYWWRGGAALRGPARSILLAAIVAAVLAVTLYYGHFGDVYRTLARVRAETRTTEVMQPAPPAVTTPVHRRAMTALGITVKDLGWPIVVLAGIGLLRLRAAATADRLVLVVGAFGVTYILFATFATIVPVGARFERYAAEFVGRVDFAVYPAAVILAARGAVWMLGDGLVARVSGVALLGFAAANAIKEWYSWIQ